MFKKLAIGCLGMVILLFALLGVALLLNWGGVRTRGQNLIHIVQEPVQSDVTTVDGMVDFLEEMGDDVSFVSYYVTPTGEIDESRPVILHNEAQPMVLASTVKIVVLAAYAEAVSTGVVDPNSTVRVDEWEQFYLPQTDGGAHPAALAELGIETDDVGFALDGSQMVTLEQIAWAMIRYSDNAAPDYLMSLLGVEAFERVVEEQGLTGQEAYVSLTGLFLLWQNHEQPNSGEAQVRELARLTPTEVEAGAQELAERYVTDEAWRAAELAWRLEKGINVIEYEALLVTGLAPRGTAVDYASMMAGVVTGNFISPEASAVMRPFLEWPMANEPIQADFAAFGSKGGSLVKVLNEASYAITVEEGAQPQVMVLFMNEVPLAAWIQIMQNFSQQALMIEMMKDEAFRQAVWERLEGA